MLRAIRRIRSGTASPGSWMLLVISLLVIAPMLVGCRAQAPDKPAQTVITYSFDPVSETWVAERQSVPASPGPDGPASAKGNTIIIRLDANEPVREIKVVEGLITGGTQPLFEIAGQPSVTGNGSIRIGELTLDHVDARRLRVRNTEVVELVSGNVSAQDDELDVDITPVGAIMVGRGGTAVLFLENFRADRIRILGPLGEDGFIERLIVESSSVFGTIEVTDVQVQRFTLSFVQLEE